MDYATSDATATAESDYTATSGTLTFTAGEISKTVSVPVLNDARDEGAETMKLTLANASGARIADDSATGTIKNSDPMPRAWMLRFDRAVRSQVVDALTGRFDAANASHVTLGGLRFGPEAIRAHSDAPDAARAMGMDDLIRDGSFHLSAGSNGPGSAALSAWGRIAHDRFEADVGGVAHDGAVTSALFGADVEWNEALAGLPPVSPMPAVCATS